MENANSSESMGTLVPRKQLYYVTLETPVESFEVPVRAKSLEQALELAEKEYGGTENDYYQVTRIRPQRDGSK